MIEEQLNQNNNNETNLLFNSSEQPSASETKDAVDQVMAQAKPVPTAKPEAANPTINISLNKLLVIKKMADNLQASAKQLSELLTTYVADQEIKSKPVAQKPVSPQPSITPQEARQPNGRVIEGIFNGEKMVGPDGHLYDVPVNYASKSKLVEGDMLKLIITERGTFVYKQIQPVERARIVGILEQGPTGEYYAAVNDRRWRILSASVSYFNGQIGDEVIMLIPREGSSRWAAVENIINKQQ